ncbi:MAG TPA: alpha-galactosidase, partial [Sphaerochaeta sp.]|nr:alpha-galactosidase [Sphaerochaeta sp.]
ISAKRLEESRGILEAINQTINEGRAKIRVYHGMERLEDALRDAAFVVNAIQVGGYDPATLTDFEIPRKYGLRQTIGDTIGIGGIMRGLRTIPVMERFASVMERACPGALLLNYTNPMSILTGYMLRYTDVACVGLCHSVQVCSEMLLKDLGMEDALEGRVETIAGINHMAWLLSLRDKEGNDLYPEIRKRALAKNAEEKHGDMVRYEYIRRLGYYCTESSEHNAEYNPFFIKRSYPELIDRFNIPLDEYLRRCVDQIEEWGEEFKRISSQGGVDHSRSHEYASYIMNAVATNTPFKIHGNVLNDHLIDNLDVNACVEVPCLVDGNGINPCRVGSLPVHLAAMNMTNVNVHLTTIEAARTKRVEDIYHAAMLDPHTAAELSIDDIVSMCDEMIEAHGPLMEVYT